MAGNTQPTNGITIVSDPGLDDLLALALLQKLTPGVPKQLVATFGNMPVETTAQNAQDFVRLAGEDWSYRQGVSAAMRGAPTEPWMDGQQGKNGLWDIRPAGVLDPVPDAAVADNRRVISIATLSEVLKLSRRGPIDELLIMGGVFDRFEENGNPAELNIRLDVRAAQQVFADFATTAITVVPAEVAFDVSWSRQAVASISETSALNTWLKQLLLAGYDNGRYVAGNELYDPLAILLGFCPQYAQWYRRGITVLADGRTVAAGTNPPCQIAGRVKDPAQVADLLFRLIFTEERR